MSNRILNAALPWPKLKSDLAPAERLVVEAFRRWLLGAQESRGQHWAMAWNEFAELLGPADGRAGFAGLVAIMREIGEHGRRTLRYHPVCCPCVSSDELWLIGVVAACQRGDLNRAQRQAEWMVQGDGIGDVLGAACNLACALKAHDLIMPVRAGETTPQRV